MSRASPVAAGAGSAPKQDLTVTAITVDIRPRSLGMRILRAYSRVLR